MKDSGLHMEQLREQLREAKRTRAELVVSAAGWKARGNKIAVLYAREESDDEL